MSTHAFETPNEKAVSGALALVMHAMFFAMLVVGVDWQKREPVAMVAELWSNLPSPKVEIAPPPPKVEPKPQPKGEVKPAPKVEPKPQPKAEIDLREKKEKERKAREQALADKKKREEREKAQALRQQRAKEAADAKRREQEQADALKKLAAQQAAARAGELEKYRQAIAEHIKRRIVAPANLQGNPEVEFEVIQLPGGEILGVKTRRASGQTPWDVAVERAIIKAQPLPPPPDPAMFKDVRELHLKFRPKE